VGIDIHLPRVMNFIIALFAGDSLGRCCCLCPDFRSDDGQADTFHSFEALNGHRNGIPYGRCLRVHRQDAFISNEIVAAS
jgi:hypothetical protein